MKNLHELMARFDALSQRERVIVTLALLVSLCLLAFILLIEPILLQSETAKKQLNNFTVQIKAANTQISALEKVLRQDPDKANIEKLERLKVQQSNIDKKLREKMQGLIEPAKMAHVLEVVLSKTSQLQLQKLNNLPTRPLITQEGDGEASALQDIGVYQHGLQIELSGSYMGMLEYLQALKSLPWDFYWDRLDLEVGKYPRSTITIEVHTLSFNKGWIGV